jgi:hypothetical protein
MTLSKVRTAVVAIGLAVSAAAPLATASPTAQITGGYTLTEFFPEFGAALGSLGIAVSKVLPANVSATFGFIPITGGRIDASNAKGEIPHAGGLTLTKGTTRVQLTDFVIDTASGAPRLTGLVAVNGSILGRVPLFDLALRPLTLPLQLPPGPELLQIDGSRMTLTHEAASALNSVFGTTAFAGGFGIGIASVYANY